MVKGCILYLKSFLSSYSNVHCTLYSASLVEMKSIVSHSESVLTHLEILKCSKNS